jgi:3-deoxy-D-manno-octulosonic-acid transferase
MILDALAPLMRERPDLLLLLAPRHPERFDEAARLLENCGFPWCRRSALGDGAPPPGCRVLLLDSLGELAGVYGECTAAFVGGSLVPEGGHNILEPAFFGRPVLFGPHMDNFAEMAELFVRREAAVRLSGPEQLAPAVRRLLDDPPAAEACGRRARLILEENQGASSAIADALFRLAGDSATGEQWP